MALSWEDVADDWESASDTSDGGDDRDTREKAVDDLEDTTDVGEVGETLSGLEDGVDELDETVNLLDDGVGHLGEVDSDGGVDTEDGDVGGGVDSAGDGGHLAKERVEEADDAAELALLLERSWSSEDRRGERADSEG